jgi:hypothetical protein
VRPSTTVRSTVVAPMSRVSTLNRLGQKVDGRYPELPEAQVP